MMIEIRGILAEEVVEVVFEPLEVPSHYFPSVWLQPRLLEELAIEVRVALQFRYLFQKALVVAAVLPEEDGIVVDHIGFGVSACTPVDWNTPRPNAVE